MQTAPVLRRKRLCDFISLIEAAASPEFAVLAPVSNPRYLYLRTQRACLIARLQKIRRTMNADGVMDNIPNAFERSGMTLNELGEGLGYDG